MTAIEQKTAIVTGAGTGIGKSVATALLAAGWNTVFCGRRKAMLEEAIADAGQTQARALAVACDISKAAEVDDMFETVLEAFGRVDLLFNNAGMGYKSTLIDEIPVEVWNDVVGVKNPTSAPDQEAQAPKSPATAQVPRNSVESSNGEKGSPATGKPDAQGATGSEVSKASRQGAGREESQAASSQAKPGLMDRMKDAMSSLMAKMSPSNSSQSTRQTSTHNSAAPDADQNQSQGDQSQMQASSSQNSRSNADAQSKNGQTGRATEMSQLPQSQSARASNREAGNQSKSGVGSQNGTKALKDAEELQAMGKLAEIIGKRSKDVTGEMMVEAPSGQQQLRTAYSDRVGRHSDTGGEINRDEVPLIFQQYVREYMERVHRQPPPQ